MSWLGMVNLRVIVVLCWLSQLGESISQGEELDFTTLDVSQLATHAHGTELFLLENRYRDQSTYRFEDFFWTGSVDEPHDDNPWSIEKPETIYETKTVVQTVFIESPQSIYNETSPNSTKCTNNCPTTSPSIPDGEISPSPTYKITTESNLEIDEEEDDFFDADRQFWLLTVLRSDGKDPVIIDLKNSLAKLYRKAFERQQARHLGLRSRDKREAQDKPISVHIHKMNTSKLNGDQKIEVLYHVSVNGKPVPAITAASDMNFISDEEVRDTLGYPFIIKAEPYLKPSVPQSLSKARNTWVFIGVSMIAFLVFLLVIAFITLWLAQKKKLPTSPNLGTENRQHIFERGVSQTNKGFVEEKGQAKNGNSPTYVRYKNETSTLIRNVIDSPNRAASSISSSSSSSTSLDISPLMQAKKKIIKKPLRPRAAYNKTAPITLTQMPPEVFDSDSCSSRKNTPDTVFIGNYDPGVMSPKSYLSMPSVKAFPRGNMPEPLNKVLEPVSILHLDMPDDGPVYTQSKSTKHPTFLTRHGSVGAVEDPGVIGPVVWNMHCQRLQHGVSVDEGISDLKGDNVSTMRKRFHDLLDDTFSLFGSRNSPAGVDQQSKNISIEVKSHSALNNRSSDELRAPTPKPRPKTSDLTKIDKNPRSPKGAWSSKAPSPLVRPLSAGIVNPARRINRDHILAEGRFGSNDPAVPLISAIKSEIEKVSLPGSTTDLRH